jgi:hypothetical protein
MAKAPGIKKICLPAGQIFDLSDEKEIKKRIFPENDSKEEGFVF